MVQILDSEEAPYRRDKAKGKLDHFVNFVVTKRIWRALRCEDAGREVSKSAYSIFHCNRSFGRRGIRVRSRARYAIRVAPSSRGSRSPSPTRTRTYRSAPLAAGGARIRSRP